MSRRQATWVSIASIVFSRQEVPDFLERANQETIARNSQRRLNAEMSIFINGFPSFDDGSLLSPATRQASRVFNLRAEHARRPDILVNSSRNCQDILSDGLPNRQVRPSNGSSCGSFPALGYGQVLPDHSRSATSAQRSWYAYLKGQSRFI